MELLHVRHSSRASKKQLIGGTLELFRFTIKF